MRTRILKRVTTAVLVVVALLPVAWFVTAALTGATLITFRTGSMSPTMPQGAVAVSLPVRAPEIVVDDVVTVQRAEARLPVTHRVVEVHPVPDQPAARELILKGDDNDTVDAQPYVITEARRVLFAVPHLGTALMVLQSPIGMGIMVLAAGTFTVWAFWPGRTTEDAASVADTANAVAR